MQAGEKIRGGIACVGLIALTTFTSVGQTMTLKFAADGSATRLHTATNGVSFERYDAEHRLLESIHYFPDGKKNRMSDNFRYENDLLVEHSQYLYTRGYDRNLYTLDANGNRIMSRHLHSENGSDWVEDEFKEEAFDSKGNRTYFNCRSSQYGGFSHIAIKTNYNYQTGECVEHEFEYDEKGNVTNTSMRRRSILTLEMHNTGDFVFDVNKHGPNLRYGRVLTWNGTNGEGNAQERVFMDEHVWSQVVDNRGRVTRISLDQSSGYENDIPQYSEDEWLEYRYDTQGLLIEIESKHYSLPKEKTTFSHGASIVAKRYQMGKNGSWNLIDTKTVESIAEFTPPLQSVRPNSGTSESISATTAPRPSVRPNASVAESVQNTPNNYNGNQAIVRDLSELPASTGEQTSVVVNAADAERLSHVADVLSHFTGATITEADVLALAMSRFIETYKSDLREMNTAYLKDKVEVFD